MARLLRVQFTGAIYHAMVRGNEGRSICRDERDYRRLLEKLAEAREVDAVRVYLVCLMPNHVHLLVETPRGNLSAFMGRWLTGYTVYFNRRHQRVGHLTQGRYQAPVVEGDQYLLNAGLNQREAAGVLGRGSGEPTGGAVTPGHGGGKAMARGGG